MSEKDGRGLLDELIEHATQEKFVYKHQWQNDDIVMWDNRCTQHSVLNDFEGERVIQRVTVMGDVPEAAVPPRWAPAIQPISAASRHDRQLQSFLSQREGDG